MPTESNESRALATTAPMELSTIERMAAICAKSGLFGMKTPEQAAALMLLCQAENIHPMLAVRDYHIVGTRPALKADAMLARYQQVGGRVRWETITDSVCAATFSHPSSGDVRIEWTMERALRIEDYSYKTNKMEKLTDKQVWKNYPRQMLRARVISEGVRTSYPAVVCGIYTPEEVGDMVPDEQNGNGHRHDANPVAAPVALAPEPPKTETTTTLQMKNGNVVTVTTAASAPTITIEQEPPATQTPAETTTLPVEAKPSIQAINDAIANCSLIQDDPLLKELAAFCSVDDGKRRKCTEDERNGLFWFSEHSLCPNVKSTDKSSDLYRAYIAKASKNQELGLTTARALVRRGLQLIEEAHRG